MSVWDLFRQSRLRPIKAPVHVDIVQLKRLNCILTVFVFLPDFSSTEANVVLILDCERVNHVIYSSKCSHSLWITVLCKGAKRSVNHPMFSFTLNLLCVKWKIHLYNYTKQERLENQQERHQKTNCTNSKWLFW